MIGIIIVFGAPAIVGGGLVYHVVHNWFAVAIFEALLIVGAATTAYKAAGKSAANHH